jgi:hypothetical protein
MLPAADPIRRCVQTMLPPKNAASLLKKWKKWKKWKTGKVERADFCNQLRFPRHPLSFGLKPEATNARRAATARIATG